MYEKSFVLKDFSLQLNEGEKVVIYGESGSGKSSFFRILLGFEENYSGSVALNRSDLAWVPQEFSLPVDTLHDAIHELFSLKRNRGNTPKDEAVLHLLQELGVRVHSLDKKLHELSGGERQRFFIVLALLSNKSILLLDEPTSALDPASTLKLAQVLKHAEITLLVISHDPVFAKAFDRTIHFTK